nr:MAG TPA: tail fiber protein [Caudoviricetes sp.]
MAYSKHTWLARIGENLNRFLNTTTGQYGIYQSAPTSISQEGTPFNVTWMNEMEDGIAQGADRISPNLLINTNFLSPINQRGMTSYNTVNKYGIDRWRLYGGSPSLSVSASGVTVSGGSILQPVENINSLAGTTFTLSAKKSGVPSESITGVLSTNTVASSTTYDMEFYISGNYVNVRLGIGTWEWVKFEVGEYASAYSPRPYADELAMCRRYYQTFPGKLDTPIIQYKGGTGYAYYPIEEMRVTPSVSCSTVIAYLSKDDSNLGEGNAVGGSPNTIAASRGGVGAGAYIEMTDTVCDAEIY